VVLRGPGVTVRVGTGFEPLSPGRGNGCESGQWVEEEPSSNLLAAVVVGGCVLHSHHPSSEAVIATWRPDGILKALLIWSAVTFITFWLPAMRGLMDGATYEWSSFFGFSGAGVSGDYWFPVLASALAIWFLYLGYRGARMPFPLLLLGWHGLMAAGATWAALSFPERFRFRGDTLGVDFSLAWVGPALCGGFFLLAFYSACC
jgi:hypothetical protein